MTAPSSPLPSSPFSGVSAASLASIANITARQSSSRSTSLPPTQPSHSLDYTTYNLNQAKGSTSPPPLNIVPSLPWSQPQAVLSCLGTSPEHQLLAPLSAGPALSDSMTINSPLREESPSIGHAELPTPPSSSAGIPSARGSRVSSPPLHLPQPLLKQEILSHSPPQPPAAIASASLPLTASASSIHLELSHSSQILASSSQRDIPSWQEQTSPPSRQRAQTHAAHPGPISLPPPSAFVVPSTHNFTPMSPTLVPGIHISPLRQPGVLPNLSPHAHPHSPIRHSMYSHARSPLQHPAHTSSLNMTPSGLPPITPSMPSFQFVPGPPTLSHSNHPAVAFSPVSTMSPGAFWGRPGGNPLTNAAVGAPVTKGGGGGEFDYFSGASTDVNEGEPKDVIGLGERSASSVPAIENGVDQEVSTSNGSSGRSANERIGLSGRSGVDRVIEQSHHNLDISIPSNTPCTEGLGHSRAVSPLPPSLIRRSESDPVPEQGHRSSRSGMETRANSADGAGLEQVTELTCVKMRLRLGE